MRDEFRETWNREASVRVLILGAAALLASSTVALAGDDVMAGYYGNTVVAKGAMGESRVHFKVDHTFDGTASSMLGSMALKGSWKIDDKGQLCRTYDTAPPGVPNPLCTSVDPHKPGDAWTMTMGDQKRQISLVQGIQ